MSKTNKKLKAALTKLNNHYGRGEITRHIILTKVNEESLTGLAFRRISVSQSGGFIEQRVFRVVRGTLHFLGHQRKLTP